MTRLRRLILLCSFYCIFSIANATVSSDQPVHINSDRATYDNKQGIATYIGHVEVIQGARNLHADKLTIIRDVNNQIQVMVATGKPARFEALDNVDKPGSGTADTIKYYPQLNKVDLINNASLTQNGDTIAGPKLTYNFATEELQGNSFKQERTTIILQPKRVP